MAAQEHADPQTEIATLRARVDELERELAEQARTTNALVAASQERLYWYDRWGIDLGRLMARPGAEGALNGLKVVRNGVRKVRQAKRRVLG